MPGSYYTNPVEFLINTLFGIYIMLVMLRFLLQWVRADFYNPVSQFLVKATNPPLQPLRRMIPGRGRIDIAAIVLMLVLQMIATLLIMVIRGFGVNVIALIIISFAQLLELLLNVFMFAIIIQVIISWINPGSYNPALSLLYSLTEPLLRPARRMIPPISGLDLSPLIVIVAIQLLKMILIPPITHLF